LLNDKEVYRRYYEKATEIHALATEYNTDPWTVVWEWPFERYDFNINVLIRAKDVEAEQYKKAQTKAQRSRR
jgi:hypothetical protein